MKQKKTTDVAYLNFLTHSRPILTNVLGMSPIAKYSKLIMNTTFIKGLLEPQVKFGKHYSQNDFFLIETFTVWTEV